MRKRRLEREGSRRGWIVGGGSRCLSAERIENTLGGEKNKSPKQETEGPHQQGKLVPEWSQELGTKI